VAEKDNTTKTVPLRLKCIRDNVDGIFSLRVDIDHTAQPPSSGGAGIVKGVRIDLIGDKEGSHLNLALYNVCVKLSQMIQEVHYNRDYNEADKTG
tara:strand:+ start:208 stop:492 length:285 start_codon:yes stop_codon:yes gene_type:complete